MQGQKSPLETHTTKQLLQVKICDLKLRIQHTPTQRLVERLFDEISDKGLKFKPDVWVSTSWFSPYGVPGFAIPFYLLHPRLVELEHKYLGVVEGGTDKWCMQLLRHETGHALDNAFHLRKSKRRQALFGLSKEPYPFRYRPNPERTDFVQHLEDHYAQAHPDEDWAETFAVWLDPKSDWNRRYKDTKALDKLELVDTLVGSIVGKKQVTRIIDRMDDVSKCDQTLEEYLTNKQKKYRKFAGHTNRRHNKRDRPENDWILM